MSELIDKYFAGEMTCEEKKDLFDRIESDEALKKEFLRIQKIKARDNGVFEICCCFRGISGRNFLCCEAVFIWGIRKKLYHSYGSQGTACKNRIA